MKRAAAVLVASPALAAFALLGGAASAQAGESHHGSTGKSVKGGVDSSHHGQGGRHHGHGDCVCTPKPHKPGHVSCKPNCAGHGPKPCPPPKPPVGHHPHKPHHPKPPHHGHHHPPVKPPVTPPVVHPHPPVITPPVTHKPTPTITHSHIDSHKKPPAHHSPTAQPPVLAFTASPFQLDVYGKGALAFLVVGAGLVALGRRDREVTRQIRSALPEEER